MTLRVLLLGLVLFLPAPGCRRSEPSARPEARAAPEYLEQVTGGAAPDDPLPLIVAIHGYGDRPESFSGLAAGFPGRARWIFPRGFEAQGSGHAWFPIRFRDGRAEALASGLDAASRRVAAFVLRVKRERPTQGAVIVTGFSQGGMISFALAMHEVPAIDFAFPMGGWLPESMIPTDRRPKVPILAFHGAEDRVVPFEATKDMMRVLSTRAEQVEFVPIEGVGHRLTDEVRLALFEALGRALESP